jgi:2-enoate reductase
MAPMGIGALIGFDGLFSERAIDYYEERAKGGIGLIITAVCLATNKFEPWEVDGLKLLPTLDYLAKARNLKHLTERIHDHGCKIFAQLTAGWGRVYRPSLSEITGHRAFAPSETPLFWTPSLTTRKMTVKEIEGLVEALGKAAHIARAGGFDGVELHGHEGYLMDQFMTALWNRRTDRYGGDLTGRMQFSLSVINNIQRMAGDDFPIIYRYGLEHKIEGGRTREEGLKIAKILERAGIASLHVDAGCYENWYWPHPPEYQPPGCMVEMAELVKKHIKIPVITVGRLGYPQLANKVIEEGKADFVALGRPLLADPEFANKARRGQVEDIRPCIGCHECFRRLYESTYISCAVNPSCGNERRLEIRKAEDPKKVMVIGGGIAGMEAARVCAMRGHRVVLYEQTGRLGGLLYSVARHSLKKDLKRLLDYQVRQVRLSNLKSI